MKLAQERMANQQTTKYASKQYDKQNAFASKQHNQKNRLESRLVSHVPLLAPLIFVVSVSMAGCAKNNPPATNPSSVAREQTAQSETPNEPQPLPAPNLQQEGPFMEPVCRAPAPKDSFISTKNPQPVPKTKNQNTFASNPQPATQNPKTYPEALESLRDGGFDGVADAIESRVSQKSRKMKIDEERAVKISAYISSNLPKMPKTHELERTMPRSVVELVVAVEERGVSRGEAEKMADFMLGFTSAMRFGNLAQFDSNLSHVIGREWSQIDYSEENTTWQQRKRQWSAAGVVNFKKAEYLEKYFMKDKEMGYFRRIYKPEGEWP